MIGDPYSIAQMIGFGIVSSLVGLAAVVPLRELLIRHLAHAFAALRPRQSLAIMLRLNRVIDKGIAVAVVGYTDALVATLFAQNGVPTAGAEYDRAGVERQLEVLEQELNSLVRQPQQ